MSARVACVRCGRSFRPTKGRIRAHECPHGAICRPPKKTRLRGEACALCLEARQEKLFARSPVQGELFDRSLLAPRSRTP